MDWLVRPLLFFALFTCVFGKECSFEKCSDAYHNSMHESDIEEPEASPEYCEIVKTYQSCLKNSSKHCRGNLQYHGTVKGIDTVLQNYCRTKGSGGGQNRNGDRPRAGPIATQKPMLPSCKYYGSFRFRHCGLYGDPHLKTFLGLYQTCRVSGTWTMIDNSYMSVQVTSAPIAQGSHATAPVKISVVVKGHSTPCTLEKRYEADSRYQLPPTFSDGTERSGADETVRLDYSASVEEDRESVEITMKYIASRLMIRRKGKYLAFNAKLPVEVLDISKSDDDGSKIELCSKGCPISEQLNPMLARGHVIEREEALKLCRSQTAAVNLTDNYLDWCVFDVMTAGTDKDFIDAAHLAQVDALILDPDSLANRTNLLDNIPYDRIKSPNSAPSSVIGSTLSFQLPICIFSLILTFLYRRLLTSV